MLKLVMINSGAAFQMNGEKKQVAEYFIKLLCENIWIKNEQEIDDYQAGFVASYKALGDYVAQMDKLAKNTSKYNLSVNYDFQSITILNLLPLIKFFINLDHSAESKNYKELENYDQVRLRDLKRIYEHLVEKEKDFAQEQGLNPENIYLTFTKQSVHQNWNQILKNNLDLAKDYFEDHDKTGTTKIYQKYSRFYDRIRLAEKYMRNKDDALINLLADYLRHMDSNYIDCSKNYFKDRFTFVDLLQTDRSNKMFSRVAHLQMVGGLPAYSVNVAVRYLIQKMREEKTEIYLDTDSNTDNFSSQFFSEDKPKYSQAALRNLIEDVVSENNPVEAIKEPQTAFDLQQAHLEENHDFKNFAKEAEGKSEQFFDQTSTKLSDDVSTQSNDSDHKQEPICLKEEQCSASDVIVLQPTSLKKKSNASNLLRKSVTGQSAKINLLEGNYSGTECYIHRKFFSDRNQYLDIEDQVLQQSNILLYMEYINARNKIRTKYYQQLLLSLARNKSIFESKFVQSFESSVIFGMDALNKYVAYQHIESFLDRGEFIICIDTTDEKVINIYTQEDERFQEIISREKKGGFSFGQRITQTPIHEIESGIVNNNPNLLMIKTSRDLLNYLSSSKELEDFTTLGVDKKGFKAALHKILFTLKNKLISEYDDRKFKDYKVVPENFSALIQQTLFDFMSSVIFQELLNNNSSMRDFSFLMRCRSLNFIKVQDMIQRDDPQGRIAYMGDYLNSIIEILKRLDEGGSLYMILDIVNQAITGIIDLFYVVLGNKEPPGTEDILPIFMFCLLRANLQRMLSIFYFLDLMMIKEERSGSDGFHLNQIETGIYFIENLVPSQVGYKDDDFEKKVMQMEIHYDIQEYRLRKPHRYKEFDKFQVSKEYSFFQAMAICICRALLTQITKINDFEEIQ